MKRNENVFWRLNSRYWAVHTVCAFGYVNCGTYDSLGASSFVSITHRSDFPTQVHIKLGKMSLFKMGKGFLILMVILLTVCLINNK